MSGLVKRHFPGLFAFSFLLFLVVYSLTFGSNVVQFDDNLQARTGYRIRQIKEECLSRPTARPLEEADDCREPDPFLGQMGSTCAWASSPPVLSCRIGSLVFPVIHSVRHMAFHEWPLILLERAVGALNSIRLATLFLLGLSLALLHLHFVRYSAPVWIYPFLGVSAGFISHMQADIGLMSAPFLVYLSLFLLASPSRSSALTGLVAFGAASLILLYMVGSALPIALILLSTGHRRRAAGITALAVGILAAWTVASQLAPQLSSEYHYRLISNPVWHKTPQHLLLFARDSLWLMSLSWKLDLAVYSDKVRQLSMPHLDASLLELGLPEAAILLFSLASIGFGNSKVKKLYGLMLVSLIPPFVAASNNFNAYFHRFQLFFPLSLLAFALGVEQLGTLLPFQKWRYWRPILRGLAISLLSFSCIHYVVDFRSDGPAMVTSASFHLRLSEHLRRSNIHSPLMLANLSAGNLELLSAGTVRPIHVPPSDPPSTGFSTPDTLLAPWTKLGKGTLLVASRDAFQWPTVNLSRPDLLGFAEKNGIRITLLDFVPYRGAEGYWIIGFTNNRFNTRRTDSIPPRRPGGGVS